MNIDKIREILDAGLPEGITQAAIISVLAEDERVVPMILDLLDQERKTKKELLEDINLLLSKAHVGLEDKKFNKEDFIQKEIAEFYKKNKDKVGHCFKNME